MRFALQIQRDETFFSAHVCTKNEKREGGERDRRMSKCQRTDEDDALELSYGSLSLSLSLLPLCVTTAFRLNPCFPTAT